jgi:excisionase family DNA binding protein
MERFLSPQEAAELLGVKTSTLYTWAYRRQIPSQKVGRLLRFSPSALTAWLMAQARPLDESGPDRWTGAQEARCGHCGRILPDCEQDAGVCGDRRSCTAIMRCGS